MQNPFERDVSVNGISIRCRIEGREGGPWLVFSNSLMMNLSLWDDQIPAFADRFRILRYDQRGQGHSTINSDPCTLDLLVDDAIALLDALNIDAVNFVGISMGSGMALRMAQRFPKRLERIIMSSGNVATNAAAAWQERVDTALTNGMEALVEPTVRRWFHPDSLRSNGPGVQRVREMIRTTPLQGFVACAKVLQCYDIQSDLSKVRVPTLLLAGEADGATPLVQVNRHRELQKRIWGSHRVAIPNAGHLANIEVPSAFNALMAEFLKDTA